MIYHREFINTIIISQEILINSLKNEGEIGFEKISLDGQDGYNDLGDDIFNIERILLNEGSYKLDIIMLSKINLLTKIKI